MASLPGAFTLASLAIVYLLYLNSAGVNLSRAASQVWTREQTEIAGFVHHGSFIVSALPQHFIPTTALPLNFSWCDHEGVNYCTKTLNQHIPQFCGDLVPSKNCILEH
jgi:hypothetical protein